MSRCGSVSSESGGGGDWYWKVAGCGKKAIFGYYLTQNSIMQVLSQNTPQALDTIAQGSVAAATVPSVSERIMCVYPEGVKQNDAHDLVV